MYVSISTMNTGRCIYFLTSIVRIRLKYRVEKEKRKKDESNKKEKKEKYCPK